MRNNTRDAMATNMTQQGTNGRKVTEKNAKGEPPTCTMCLSTKPLDVTRKLPLPNEKYVVAFRVFFVPAQGNAVHPCGALTGTLMDIA